MPSSSSPSPITLDGQGSKPNNYVDVRSVNYFISRTCNYKCKFCFHTPKNSDMLPLSEAKRRLQLLREAGTQKVNFAGGEPFLHPEYLGQLCLYAQSLGIAVTIISNGSRITESWMSTHAQYVDIFGVSVDSFNISTNLAIGRLGDANSSHVEHLHRVHDLCTKHNVLFKLNTVVCSLNWQEDIRSIVRKLDPYRWKVFQCLILGGENAGSARDLRNATNLVVSDQQFCHFVEKHAQALPQLIPEPVHVIRDSYLLLDEKKRFLNCSNNSKIPGASILDVGVHKAITQSGFDSIAFQKRGGVYKWKKTTFRI